MEILTLSLIAIAGLCYGSFLNVLIHRTQSGESILFPASKCPKCDVPLKWWHNIPLFSYFYLNGRCYYCNKIISIQYPIVEFLGMILFIFSFSVYKSIYDAICVILIASLFFTQAVVDSRIQKVSTTQSLVIISAGLIFNRYDLTTSIMGMLTAGLVIFGIKKLGEKYFEKEIFGTGDIYLFGALGSVIGFDKIFLYIFYALLLQVAMFLPLRLKELKERNKDIPKYLIIFSITCLFLYIIKNKNFNGEIFVYLISMAILLFSAHFLIKELCASLQESENTQYCALAPAIAISCLIFLI